MIDSDWFYQQLERQGRTIGDLGEALGIDKAAVSRMLRGLRKMSAEEQDGIAAFFGRPLAEVAAHRRGVAGFTEEKAAPYKVGPGKGKTPREGDDEKPRRPHPMFGCMKGTLTIAEGVDLTEPADPEWGRVYED